MAENKKGLTSWQLAMMALGTVVGGSFFLGSAVAIHAAGPSVIFSYIFGGILVYLILFALSELTVADPDPGSFRTFAEREFGPWLGFVVGWVYWSGITLAMSSESIAISTFFRQWFPDISLPLIGSIIIVLVTLLNLLGAEKLSKLESGLAAVKLLAIGGFIILGVVLILNAIIDTQKIEIGALAQETFFLGGIRGIAGSMLIVMFTYAGFEVIGLAASETSNPHATVPKAILYTVATLTGLYILAIIVLLLLAPTNIFTEEQSPLVIALTRWNLSWAGEIMNIVLISAILSTMLAAMFGLGRMIRSLSNEGHAPMWLKDKGDIPYKGILFSGSAMLVGLFLSFALPKRVYIFLVSSGGYSLLFTYLVILISHYKFRKRNGCPPKGKCQFPGYPYASWIAIISLVVIILSMPLIPGQGLGLLAGISLTLLYLIIYLVRKYFIYTLKYKRKVCKEKNITLLDKKLTPKTHMEISKELISNTQDEKKIKE